MADKSYVALTACVVAHTDGGDRYFYRGSPLSDDVPADEVKRLLDGGHIGPEGDLEEEGAKPAAKKAAGK